MTAALEGGEWSAQHAPAELYPRERLGTHFTGGWVGPRAGLDGWNKNEYHEYFVGGKGGRYVALKTLPPSCAVVTKSGRLNLLDPELFFFSFSTPVYKMRIIQEPNTIELLNKQHFEEEKTESTHHV